MKRLRAWTTLALVAGVAMGCTASAASAATVVTWGGAGVAESRFVDPSKAPAGHYNEPPGVPDRPNALRANVYLPDGYDPESDRRYPVLFLLHGQGDGFDTWAHPERGNLLEVAAGFPGIIVMPEGDRGFYANWWNDGLLGDPQWERYHLDQLVPLVQRRLPIRRGRRWHALAGLSMGGEGTMFYASQRPGYFGSAAAFSGPLSIQRPTFQNAFPATGQRAEPIFGEPDAQEFYWRGHNPKELVDNLVHTRLFVSAGDGVPNPESQDELDNTFGQLAEAELGQQAAEFAGAAEAVGAEVEYRPHQGIHDWPYWRADLAAAIEWGLFRPPPRPSGTWTYETVARVGRMWGLGFRFAEQPATVETFSRDGRTLSGDGAGRATIRTPGGCRIRATLPFEVDLRSACGS